MTRNRKKPRISSCWEDYQTSGTIRERNARFVFFKTPIRCKNFGPENLVKHLAKQDCKLGLVIDLTDTNKYYDPEEFVAQNIVHYKIKCNGMRIPSEDIVEHFQMIVSRFFKEHMHDKKFVGVHCFAGINRTGYLICRYLIDVMGWDAVSAITRFQEERGHNFEHEFLSHHLLKHQLRTNETKEEKKCIIM